jgi:hypothetical protein
MKVRELLSSPEKWTKDVGARDAHGNMCFPTDKQAVCWCLGEAIGLCYCNNRDHRKVRELVLYRIGRMASISPWNDAPERTYEEVKALVDELDI